MASAAARNRAERIQSMGMKKRPTIHCAVVRGEMRSWEHCQCVACLTRQLAVLNARLEKAKEIEG